MAYKAVYNGNSLYHFNPNHDKKNGRFTFKKAYDVLDNAVAKGYDVSEKVVKGAIRGIGEEFRNHPSTEINKQSPKSDTSTKKEQKPVEENKEDLSAIEKRVKKENLLDEDYKTYKSETGPSYKRMKAASDTGLKALQKLGDKEVEIDTPEHWDYWFLFEDQTYGMPQIADLANQGKTKEQIKQIIKDCVNFTLYDDNDEFPDIPGLYSLYLYNEEADYKPYGNMDSFIDACIEAAKESKQIKHSGTTQFGNYLCNYNKNHSKANGQFVSGDGDSDGVADEHHRHSKNGIKEAKGDQGFRKISEKASNNTVKNAHREFTKKHIKEANEAREAALDWIDDSSRENNIKYIEKVKTFLEGLGEYTAKALLNEYGERAVIDTYNKESKDSKVKDSNDFIKKHKEQTVDAYWDPEDLEYMIEAWENDWN